MLLLLLDSLLLLFISFSLGSIAKKILSGFLRTELQTSFIEDFLLGLIFSAVYFNLVSLVLPVNYLVLIPLLLLSFGWQKKRKELTFSRFFSWKEKYINTKTAFILLMLLAGTVGVYFIMPPINLDSAGYHYQTVYWYENYKVIPGLGNVHGRLAFNAINFILSAPYSFSHLAGQSLYPFNGVLVMLFYLWLLQNILQQKHNWSSIFHLITAILLLRPLIPNIASPSSEPLVIITISVVFFRLIELIRQNKHTDISYFVSLVLISFFAIIAKLTSLPLLLVPGVWILFLIKRQRPSFYFKITVIIAVIIIPWLVRNVLLSGYLFYPLYQLDIFNVDWKIPRDVAIFDYGLGTLGSKGDDRAILYSKTVLDWLPYWLDKHMLKRKLLDLITIIFSLLSALSWVVIFRRKQINKNLFILWLCAFVATMIWFFQSPEFRFGAGFLLAGFCIPLINIGNFIPLKPGFFRLFSVGILFLSFFYFSVRAVFLHPRFHTHGIESLWLKPMKDQLYYAPFDIKTIRYENLGNDVRLYYTDSIQDCLHISDQPCMQWNYGKIEMRGNKITDGFRNIRNDMRKNFPFMFIREW